MTKHAGWIGLIIVFSMVLGAGIWLWWTSADADPADNQAVESVPKVKHTKRIADQAFTAKPGTADQLFEATHRQVDLFYPTLGEQRVVLQTFCLAPNGNIWACVGGPYMFLTAEEDFIKWEQETPPMIQVYSPQLELVQQIDLPFTPTAINFDTEQQIFYVGGEGRLAQVDPSGKIVRNALAPNVGNLQTIESEVRNRMEADLQELKAMRIRQIGKLQPKLKPLLAKEKNQALNAQETRQLKSFKKLLADSQKHLEELEQTKISEQEINQTIRDRMTIKSFAIGNDYVFVGVLAADNYSYEVFRVDKQLENPKKILGYMHGCCGRFDIKATGNDFWVADNTKFRVVKYDADGNRLDAFGHGSRTEQHGFDSCCNPMNLQVYDNGEILTGESSVGHIKRFSPEGKLLAYVGKAKVAPGCKNVAIGFDPLRNTYYMLHQDEHAICILKSID